MKIKLIIYSLLSICIMNNVYSQNGRKVNVKNYDQIDVSTSIRPIENKKNHNKSEINSTNIMNSVTNERYERIIGDTLFSESFSNKSFDNLWLSNSSTDNMIGYIDPITKKKCLKITCKRQNGNSFLEYDLSNMIRGKKIQLKGYIKTENIISGGRSWEIGQLGIKFQIEDITFYECVQNLSGTSDWDNYSAQEDGSDTRDNTENGPYVIYIPENAKNVTLYLGLQNCTGTIYFKNIKVIEVK